MKRKIGSNQHKDKYRFITVKNEDRIMCVFTAMLILQILLYVFRAPIISPCADTGCSVKVVYTSEEAPELEQTIGYMTKKFSPFGSQVVYQAISVAKNESGWKKDAKGWNCHYINEQGKQYSTACKPEDRAKAWSVDCGIFQINVAGTTCPDKLLSIKENIDHAYKMYERRGWQPWVAARLLGYVN